jgi:hypothetical protein
MTDWWDLKRKKPQDRFFLYDPKATSVVNI